MRLALQVEDSPYDASLEKVVPGIQQFHHAHHKDLENMGTSLTALTESVNVGFQKMSLERKEESLAQDRRLAASFLDVASTLLTGTCTDEPVVGGHKPKSRSLRMEIDTGVPVDLRPCTPSPTGAMAPRQQSPMDRGGSPNFTGWRLHPKHTTISSMVDEWHRLASLNQRGPLPGTASVEIAGTSTGKIARSRSTRRPLASCKQWNRMPAAARRLLPRL